ncbi:MAG: rhodanese-like domain-containing protein [Anaerolineales bacterium]
MKANDARLQNLLLVGLVAGLALSACSGSTETSGASDRKGDVGQVVPVEGGGSYVDILPAELEAMLQAKDFFFVNVHVPNEGEIPGTEAHIKFDEVTQRLEEFPEQKDARVVLYCRSGGMSAIAARELVGAGYTNIYNLDGGFRAWIQAGYPFNP